MSSSFTTMIATRKTSERGRLNFRKASKRHPDCFASDLQISRMNSLLSKPLNQVETHSKKEKYQSHSKKGVRHSKRKEAKEVLPSRRNHIRNLLIGVSASFMLKLPPKNDKKFIKNESKYSQTYRANAAQDQKREIWISGKSLKEKGDKDRTGTKKDIKYLRCLSNCTSDCKKPGASIDTSDNQSCLEQCQDHCCETYEQCTYQLQKE